jgi:hypothetical protein
MFRTIQIMAISALMFSSTAAFAGAHHGPDAMKPDVFGNRTGFRGHEKELGTAVAAAIRESSPVPGDPRADFSGREMELGMAVESLMKALNNREPYQHEPNDALIKATLTSLQFAKDNDMVQEWIDAQVTTQMPMIRRVGNMIEKTGDTELGTLALTERTACFYQLVMDYEREGDLIRWRSPYWNVLAQTTRLGQHDMSEQWIHENYTVPMMEKQAAGMGMVAEVSGWQEDGWISMRVVGPEAVASN